MRKLALKICPKRQSLTIVLKRALVLAFLVISLLIQGIPATEQKFIGNEVLLNIDCSSEPLEEREGRLRQGSVEGITLKFREQVVPSDGDCGFHCLGISRSASIQQLIGQAHNSELRALVAQEIRAAFLDEENPLPWHTREIPTISQNIGEYKRLHNLYKSKQEIKEEDLAAYCHDPATFTDFLQYEYGSGPYSNREWLAYTPGLREYHQTSTLDALARASEINLMIWKGSINHLELVHHYQWSKDAPVRHLLYTQTDKGGDNRNHFNILAIQSISTTDSKIAEEDNNLKKQSTKPKATEKKDLDIDLTSHIESIPEVLDAQKLFDLGREASISAAQETDCREQNELYNQARKFYEQSARKGHARAHRNLGLIYEGGCGVKQSDEMAVEWYQKAAELGDAWGQNDLGVMYEDGRGVGQSDEEAAKWYQKAADQENAVAQNNLGRMYENGHGVEKSNEEAAKWYRKAAEQGYAWGQTNLGVMYEEGRGVGQSDEEAARWYRKAADQGNAVAQNNLGVMYANGRGVKKSDEKAAKWYRKAADQENAVAQNNLGVMYANGRGVKKSDEKAAKWYRKAAEQGDAWGQTNLGEMYEEGRGVGQSDEKAVKWYRKAADQGNAGAQTNLGLMYEEGRGVRQSKDKAVEWYQKAAGQGDAWGQNNLSLLQAHAKAWEKAIEGFRRAAYQGHAGAQYNLAMAYHEGQIVAQSDKEALKWFRKAAKNGSINAQTILASFYESGRHGAQQSDAKAFKYYSMAAKQKMIEGFHCARFYACGGGMRKSYKAACEEWRKVVDLEGEAGMKEQAKVELALMYGNGYGVLKDEMKAIQWLGKAGKKGKLLLDFYKNRQGNQRLENACAKILYSIKVGGFGSLARESNIITQYLIEEIIKEKKDKLSIEAANEYKEQSKQKDCVSQLKLGVMHTYGIGARQDPARALEWYREAAQRGNSKAQAMLGNVYECGIGVAKDISVALNWYLKSANKLDCLAIQELSYIGNPDETQLSYLGRQYFDKMAHGRAFVSKIIGKPCLRIIDPVDILFRKKSPPNSTEEIIMAERYIRNNEGSSQDLHKVRDYYINAACEGNCFAQYRLGLLCNEGSHLISKSPQFLESYINFAKEGNAEAQYSLGQMYALGHNVEKNISEAFKWYSMAAKQNHAEAQYQVGILIQERDINAAVDWYTKSAMQGHPRAQSTLGLIYMRGIGIPRDVAKAIELYTQAAEQGDDEARDALIDLNHQGNREAAAALGKLYANGAIERPSTITDQEVLQWITKAVEVQDGPIIRYRLGLMYEYGWGCDPDNSLAVACFIVAATEGRYAPAQKALAKAYRHGKGVPQSNIEALRWFRSAAKQGDAGATAAIKELADNSMCEAIYALGRAHQEGWGVARDEEEAGFQYTWAANQNYPKAQYAAALQRLEGKVPPDDLDPLLLLVILSGKESISHYCELQGQRLDRQQRKKISKLSNKDYKQYYDQGYYKAQRKLSELYERGKILPLATAQNPAAIYRESIRLYEAAVQSNKPVPLAPLERIRDSLIFFKQMDEHQRLSKDDPKFGKLLEKYAGTRKHHPKFLYQLGLLFNQIDLYSGEVHKKLKNIVHLLVGLPENSKQAEGMIHMVMAVIGSKEFKEGTQGSDNTYQLRELDTLIKDISIIRPSWCLIPSPSSIPENLKISQSMLHDPRIEIFNSYFRQAESDYDVDLFNRSVDKILHLFDRLSQMGEITQERLWGEEDNQEEESAEKGSRETLKRLLTANNASKPNNRFAHRLIRIADIVYKQYRKDPSLVASQLIQWAKRGVNCLTAGEEEMNQFYIDSIMNAKLDSGALTKQDSTLEMQIAISLAKLRYRLLEELVDRQDAQRVHTVKHLEKKARFALGLLGDAENYTDVSEAGEVDSKYIEMTSQDIVNEVMKWYTPDFIAEYIAKQVDNKMIDYEKIIRRLMFQYIRSKVAPNGMLDNSLFQDEDHLLDRCAREEFDQQILRTKSGRQNESVLERSDSIQTKADTLDWDALKVQSYENAQKQIRKEFYDKNYRFSSKGAKALLQGTHYLEKR